MPYLLANTDTVGGLHDYYMPLLSYFLTMIVAAWYGLHGHHKAYSYTLSLRCRHVMLPLQLDICDALDNLNQLIDGHQFVRAQVEWLGDIR